MTEQQHQSEPDDDDPMASALLAQSRAIVELRRDLGRLASETTDTLTALSERVDELNSEPSAAPRSSAMLAWCWRDLGPLGQQELWRELSTWVGWIRARYPLARKIPECWHEHPEVVEELTALWLAWQAAYTEPDPPLTAASDWHDRWLPGVLYRLEHGSFALGCANGHTPRPVSAYAVTTSE